MLAEVGYEAGAEAEGFMSADMAVAIVRWSGVALHVTMTG